MSKDNEAYLAWLEDELQQLRSEGQTKAVGYLEAVLDEVVFEMKMALSRDLPYGRRLEDGKRVPVLALGERGIERHPHCAGQHRRVRSVRVDRRVAI